MIKVNDTAAIYTHSPAFVPPYPALLGVVSWGYAGGVVLQGLLAFCNGSLYPRCAYVVDVSALCSFPASSPHDLSCGPTAYFAGRVRPLWRMGAGGVAYIPGVFITELQWRHRRSCLCPPRVHACTWLCYLPGVRPLGIA